MKKTKILLAVLAIGLLLVSCEKTFLGPDEANDPERNFELLWNELDRHYSLFTERNRDWDSIYRAYRPRVNAQTSEGELFSYFAEMIEYLDDSHTFIHSEDYTFYHASGYEQNQRAEYEEFSESLVKDLYLEYVRVPDPNQNLYYGKVKDKDIGYIYLADMKRGANGGVIDDILAEIGHHQAIIFDVRNNGGGSTTLPQRIAGAFADKTRLVFTHQTRNGPGHDDFSKKSELYSRPQGSQNYRKPVVLLANRSTMSASEHFILYMKAVPSVTLMGDTTAGDFGYRSNLRFLPNGWIYAYSIGRVLLPDGSNLDGIGHVPNVYVRNTLEDLYRNEDKVLESAVRYLSEKHGIE